MTIPEIKSLFNPLSLMSLVDMRCEEHKRTDKKQNLHQTFDIAGMT